MTWFTKHLRVQFIPEQLLIAPTRDNVIEYGHNCKYTFSPTRLIKLVCRMNNKRSFPHRASYRRECSMTIALSVSILFYTCKSKLAMVSAITRTQAYTAETWMADWTLTALPAPLGPKRKDGTELTAFEGLSRARPNLEKGFFIRSLLSFTDRCRSFCHGIACTGAASYFHPRRDLHLLGAEGHGQQLSQA